MPPSCPKQRFTAVTNGQQRSLAEVPDLRHRLSLDGRTVLPKLAVAHCPRSALGPHGIRKRWSRAGTSGHARQVPMSGHRRATTTTSDGRAALARVRAPQSATGSAPQRSSAGISGYQWWLTVQSNRRSSTSSLSSMDHARWRISLWFRRSSGAQPVGIRRLHGRSCSARPAPVLTSSLDVQARPRTAAGAPSCELRIDGRS